MNTSIKWYTDKTQYVDMETGEQIRTKNLGEYYVVKTDRKTLLNRNKTIGHIQHILLCRKNPQLTLNFK